MIKYINKDITTVDRGVIAHGCNTQGVMGSGVAKFLRDKYPQIFPRYAQMCQDAILGDVEEELLGNVNFVVVAENLVVANCFTQHLYGRNGVYAKPEAIEDSVSIAYGLASIIELPLYLPKIGAGRGGLDWEKDVEPIIDRFSTLDENIDTYVCVWAE